jgi:hypothetical protein
LLPLVCEELRKLAARTLAQEKLGQTHKATALVHEAYLQPVDADTAQHWKPRRWPRNRVRGNAEREGGHAAAARLEGLNR